MKHPPIVFIDVETTGGNARNSRVIDIGAIRVENGKVVKTLNQLISPERPVPYFITNLTGITNDMVWSAPRFKAIAPSLEELLNGAIFAAHHVDFDYAFIKAEFNRIGVRFNCDRACTVKLSRLLYPADHRHGLDKIIGRMKYKVENRHRGYDDAEVLWKYFEISYTKDPYQTLKALQQITVKCRKKNIVRNQTSLLDLYTAENQVVKCSNMRSIKYNEDK